MDDEEAFVSAFIIPSKRKRIIELLRNPKRRPAVLDSLNHFRGLDPRYAFRIPPGQQSAGQILKLLHDRGAPEGCYVISANRELDSRRMPLSEALSCVVGFGQGTFVSCVAGRLGYFEDEEINERYLLDRGRR